MTDADLFVQPASQAQAELRERRSRFVARLFVAGDEESAREFVREMSQKYSDATHNCWAYRVGYPDIREYWSDAGEPSGTAGKPIEGAIQRVGITNTVIVVTRYFGGIKLGVRGLIDAYGGAASMAIEKAGRATKRLCRMALVETPYEHASGLMRKLKEMDVPEEDIVTSYGAHVDLCVPVPASQESQALALFDGYLQRGMILKWKWEDDN